MYKRAAQIGNILRKEKEKQVVGDKRKKMSNQFSRSQNNFSQKKLRSFEGYQGNSFVGNAGPRRKPRNVRPLVDRDGKERRIITITVEEMLMGITMGRDFIASLAVIRVILVEIEMTILKGYVLEMVQMRYLLNRSVEEFQ